jgi:hypothetical protein
MNEVEVEKRLKRNLTIRRDQREGQCTGQRGVGRKRGGEQLVSHGLYAEREDAECMAGP